MRSTSEAPRAVVRDAPAELTLAVRWAVAGGAAVVTAVLYFFGTGLGPIPLLTWLAPIPCLVGAPHVRGWTAAIASGVGYFGGHLTLLSYVRELQVPPMLIASVFLLFAVAFATAVAVARRLVLADRLVLAPLAAAAIWTSVEFLVAQVSPHGAFSSLGYTQADVLPVLQVASLTGVWGLSFLLIWLPASLAVLLVSGLPPARRVIAAGMLVAVMAVVLGYGWLRLADAPESGVADGEGVTVALVAVDSDDERLDPRGDEGRGVLATYAEAAAREVDRGATVVVLPEKLFQLDGGRIASQLRPLVTLAERRDVLIVVGAGLREDGANHNVAVALDGTGRDPFVYRKHHLIPGIEDDLDSGTGTATVSVAGERLALTVCKDLDFPDLVRTQVRRNASIVLAPAWDFSTDGWLHSRMAVMRGVENGVAIARPARGGVLLTTDSRGRILAEERSRPGTVVTTRAMIPGAGSPTLYAAIGDWFGWACLVLAAFGCARASQPASPTNSARAAS